MQFGELPPPGALINAASKAATAASRALAIASKSGTAIGSAAAINSMIDWKSPIPITQVNDTIGWTAGDPIYNRTKSGRVPTWSTVRYRHWRNKELAHREGRITQPQVYNPTEENLQRMRKGLPPQVYDTSSESWVSVELHHNPPQRDGGLFDFEEMTPDEHAKADKHRRLKTGEK